jgi:hypothetical protein
MLVAITSRGLTGDCGGPSIFSRVDPGVLAGVPYRGAPCADNHAPDLAGVSLEVREGSEVSATLAITDPDPDDRHRLTIVSSPARGIVEIRGDGTLIYTSTGGTGRDHLTIEIEDDGYPPRRDRADLEIEVVGAGCRTTSADAPWWLFGIVLLTFRLRRSSRVRERARR